ncbi:MAG TPA: hypothetical protein VFW19_10490 [Allosphingosinicella sp.]|nr:hypothetical protein [Allosphingosinicella sp.]
MTALATIAHPALQRRPAERELVQLVTDWSGKVPHGGAVVEPKTDGIRALFIGGELVTREGNPILGTRHILEACRTIQSEFGFPVVIDGEFQVRGSFTATVGHFKAIGNRGDAGTFFAFDVLPERTWRGEDVCEALHARRAKLDEYARPFVGDALQIVPWAYMTEAAEIEARARELIAAGGEGVVVKDVNSTYRRSKSANWQRIRRSITVDAPIVGWNELRPGSGLLGSLVLDYEGVRVTVAVGFSDDERRHLWMQALDGLLLGEWVEVEAMDRTERGSLRQARFVRLRGDRERVRI